MDNRQIAEKVMGWKEVAPHIYQSSEGQLYTTNWPEMDLFKGFEPDTDIKAAWQVIEKMAESWPEISISKSRWSLNPGYYECVIERTVEDRVVVEAESAPMAICLAALKAVGVEVSDGP